MKKIIQSTILLLIISLNSNAQRFSAVNTGYQLSSTTALNSFFSEDSSLKKNSDYDYYMKKTARKKTAAWILLGGGVLATGLGALAFPENYDLLENSSATENQADFSVALSIVGIAAMASSIPFFISGSVNKRKAKAAFDYKKTGFGIPVKSASEIPGFTLSISIGK